MTASRARVAAIEYARRAVIAVCFSLALTCGSWAQDLLEIRGRVSDPKGVPVPAATVRLSSSSHGIQQETLTESDGTFAFTNLPPGTYSLTVEMAGFPKLVRDGIDPSADSSRRLALTLVNPPKAPAAGPAAARGARPGLPGTQGAPENGTFRELEMTGNQEMDASQPFSPPDAGSRAENPDLLVISGNPSASVGAIDWNDPGMRDRMMEMVGRMGFGGFTVAGPQDAGASQGERGRPGEGGFQFPGPGGMGGGPGGGPGGRGGGGPMGGPMGGPIAFGRGGLRQPRINGSVFINYRNSFFNARPYSLTGKEVDKPLQIQNNFGVSIGGPLVRTGQQQQAARGVRGRGMGQQPALWFFTYQGTRNRSPYDILTTVPTPLERSGDFSQTSLRSGLLAGKPVQIYDPTASVATPFPGNRIPESRLNPASVGLLKYVPLPNLSGPVQNFTMQRGLPNQSDSISARVNTRLGSKDNLGISYGWRRNDSISSQIFPGLDSTRTSRAHNLMLNGMHRFQPRFLVNYRVSWNRVRSLTVNPFAFQEDVAGRLGINGVSREPINYGLPAINYTNYGDLQLANTSQNTTQTITTGGGMNRIGTKHSVQVGGDFSWNQRNSLVDPNARGTFDFTGFATSNFDAQGRPIAGTGYDFADFLLGYPYSTSRRYGSSLNYLRNRTMNVFIQDNWRVRSTLTINAGLRYELILPYVEKYDHLVSLDVAPYFSAVAQVFPGRDGPYTGRFPRSLFFADKNNLGPRLGVAWKRKPTSKWTFRAGWGMFYNPSVYPYIVGQLVGQPPFAVNQNILTSLSAPLTLQNGFPKNPEVTILNSYAIAKDYRIGYVQQWNLSVQTQLRRIYTLEVGYNGSKGTRLDILRAPNRAPSGSSPGDTEDNRVITNAGNFVFQEAGANSVLHSGRVIVTRRFSQGIRLDGSYTFSKSLDNASGVGGGGLAVVQDDHNIFGERSLSSFNQTHRFQANFNLDLPFGDRRRWLANSAKLVRDAVSGWTLNGSYQLSSGTPLTPRIMGNVANNSGTGSNYSERPDATGLDPSLPRDQRMTLLWFNPLAFTIPAPGRFGNAGRYSIPGPGSSLLNLSLRKSFRLDEANRRLDFSCQITNLLNHPNYGGVSTVVNSTSYGRVTSVRGMRQMEFNFRINF